MIWQIVLTSVCINFAFCDIFSKNCQFSVEKNCNTFIISAQNSLELKWLQVLRKEGKSNGVPIKLNSATRMAISKILVSTRRFNRQNVM